MSMNIPMISRITFIRMKMTYLFVDTESSALLIAAGTLNKPSRMTSRKKENQKQDDSRAVEFRRISINLETYAFVDD